MPCLTSCWTDVNGELKVTVNTERYSSDGTHRGDKDHCTLSTPLIHIIPLSWIIHNSLDERPRSRCHEKSPRHSDSIHTSVRDLSWLSRYELLASRMQLLLFWHLRIRVKTFKNRLMKRKKGDIIIKTTTDEKSYGFICLVCGVSRVLYVPSPANQECSVYDGLLLTLNIDTV